ncbi:hypothetical protein RND81_04G207000 [Saponaria officinalis]|uniref:Phospholipid/glycerol acyltransferase domain-containing protein n=1 Tax=Saponaria officinalis TaxID=3572 RepID=A0AAW1LP58_SAPOF
MAANQYQKYYSYHQWLDRADALKSNARYLRLQLRRRFRVVVDRHLYLRRRVSFSSGTSSSSGDGRYSSVVDRWLDRARDFRRKSLSSSSAISRIKRVKQQIYAEEESAIARMVQAVAVPILGNVCHVFMHGLNRVQIYGAEKLVNAVKQKSKEKPLVTVSNHVASIDDPFVIASLLPPSVLMDAQNLRWTLCASDRCFKNPATSAFFRSVKVLPVSRGDGIYQKGMDIAISKLNSGGWVHIFPEGSRSRDGGKTTGSAKKGVGRLVVDADNTPMVVPFVHTGMQEIMPIGAKFPRIGKTVTVLIGDPMEFDDLLNGEGTEFESRGDLYDAISSRIGQRLQHLKIQVDNLALDQHRPTQELSVPSINRATGILQHIDWESFGMDSHAFFSDESTLTAQGRQNEEVVTSHQEPSISDHDNTNLTQVADNGGMMSRIQRSLDSVEFMGFAARGMLQNRLLDLSDRYKKPSPLRAWKQLLESSYGRSVQLC